jgi:hypothetical protein
MGVTFFGFTIAGVASILVSFAGFLIGMRVAKERADRALLRTLYQDLYVHFRALRDAAIGGRPKDYRDFQLVGDRFVPLWMPSKKTAGSVFYRRPLLEK